jgi:hypothetical protein
MEILKALVEQGEDLDTALSAALKSRDWYTYYNAMRLLIAYVSKGKGLDEAPAIASNAIKDFDSRIRINAMDLFKALFEQGKGQNEAIATISIQINASSYDRRNDAIKLLKALVETAGNFVQKEKVYDFAKEVINSIINDEHENIRSLAEEIRKILDASY